MSLEELFETSSPINPDPIEMIMIMKDEDSLKLTDEQFDKYCVINKCINDMEVLVRYKILISEEDYGNKRYEIIMRLTHLLLVENQV